MSQAKKIIQMDFNEYSDLKEFYCPDCHERIMVMVGNFVCAGEMKQTCPVCGTMLDWNNIKI